MDQKEVQVVEGTGEPTESPARGPILATIQIRVTVRDDVEREPGGRPAWPGIPTNDAVAELVEAAFEAAGYLHVNATAEKV